MKPVDNPATQTLKDIIRMQGLTYRDVAECSGLTLNHIRNIMSGRAKLTIDARDKISKAIGVSAGEMILRRPDLQESKSFIDLRIFPEEIQNALRCIVETLIAHTLHTKTKTIRVTKK